MRFRVQRCVFRAKDRNTLRKFSVVSQLPCISPGGIAQRLGFTGIVGIFVVTHTRAEFKAETVYRAIQKLATITCGQHIALSIAVITVCQPACLTK